MFPYWPGSFRAYHRNFDDWFETAWESWVRCAPPVSKDLIGESKCKRSSVVMSTVRASGWSFDCSEDCMVAITFLLASAVAEASKSVFARLQGLPMSRISFVPNAHLTRTALKPLKNNTAALLFFFGIMCCYCRWPEGWGRERDTVVSPETRLQFNDAWFRIWKAVWYCWGEIDRMKICIIPPCSVTYDSVIDQIHTLLSHRC